MTFSAAQSYNSNVQPGQEATSLELPGLTLFKLSVSKMHNNVYLLKDAATGKTLLIDAADDVPAIDQMLRAAQVADEDLVGIVTTHDHWDHHRALPELAARVTTTLAGEQDADDLPVAPSRRLVDGDTVQVGKQTVQVHHVPGHTPGSVVLSWSPADGSLPHIFTGDTLFPGGVGATKNNEEQDFPTLFNAVKERIFGRFEDAIVHPGHGDDTTLSTERPHLDEWEARGW